MQRTGVEEAIRQAANPVVLMQRLTDEAMALVEGAEGALVELANDEGSFTIECASGYLEERIGSKVPLAGSLTGLAFQRAETLRCDDAESDPRVERDLCRTFGVVSMVCVPLWRGGKAVGVFTVNSSRAQAFGEHDVVTLTGLADFISVAIAAAVDLAGVTDALLTRSWRDAPGAALAHTEDWTAEHRFIANVLNPGAMGKLETRNRVSRFLKGRGLSHVFQPVYDLSSGKSFAVEALARFSGQPRRSPELWFSEAHELGVGTDLEILSARTALLSVDRLPKDIVLCVNAGPQAIVCDELRDLLSGTEPSRVVMELTEQAKVDDYPRLSGALQRLQEMGVRLAIDDTGAGFASLAHILKLSPDIIKLDRELTCRIDNDPVRIALATALVSFASGLGAEIIAEGIETAAELDVLRALGIRYGQGYYLCRPTSVDSIPWRVPIDALGTGNKPARATRRVRA